MKNARLIIVWLKCFTFVIRYSLWIFILLLSIHWYEAIIQMTMRQRSWIDILQSLRIRSSDDSVCAQLDLQMWWTIRAFKVILLKIVSLSSKKIKNKIMEKLCNFGRTNWPAITISCSLMRFTPHLPWSPAVRTCVGRIFVFSGNWKCKFRFEFERRNVRSLWYIIRCPTVVRLKNTLYTSRCLTV